MTTLAWTFAPSLLFGAALILCGIWASVAHGVFSSQEKREKQDCSKEKDYEFVLNGWMGTAVFALLVGSIGMAWVLHRRLNGMKKQ